MITNSTTPRRSKEQEDESFKQSYWHHAIEYGLAYYVSGRFAVHAGVFISPNLLHHAVELLLKANLSLRDTADQIREYGYRQSYGHSLGSAWAEFKRRNDDRTLAAHDETVEKLDKVENVRYPDDLLKSGGSFSVGLYEPAPAPDGIAPEQRYEMYLPAVDRLVKLLFDKSEINPDVMRKIITQQPAARYFTENNATPLL